ncbi:hypothetical protein J5N97_007215 [Dioscorea zingiberensis]|uniref:Uncharacterized protein n=1 Tax=Dioscorea zingiberensis TaxID=325984 RepID=A0A9D5DC69_9LILI|nr:hypothetical protein J5N97_007215 [Dioscorea zingiberensis]
MDAACDLDRLFLFEHARQASEAIYSKKPHDADNLTRRGGALLELSRFQNGQFHKNMLEMLSQALEEDPGNELYVKSLELSTKAPELHQTSVGGSATSKVKWSGLSSAFSAIRTILFSELFHAHFIDILGDQ